MLIASLKSKVQSVLNKSKTSQNEDKKFNSITATPTIIAKDLKIEGQIFSSGLVEIEGKINGVIKGNSVVLLEDGNIEGEVTAKSFSINGKFNGNIKAQNVFIANKANVTGTIEYSLLSIEDGASVEAKFKKLD
ncbi:MAG: polymer-forming cytoskeletal protein [Rickettsiales bacterium]|nr:polymer-forming cytoskeletal protein [Rickettsiales bacterium]